MLDSKPVRPELPALRKVLRSRAFAQRNADLHFDNSRGQHLLKFRVPTTVRRRQWRRISATSTNNAEHTDKQ